MNSLITIPIAVWIWAVTGVIALIFATVVALFSVREGEDDWRPPAVTVVLLLGASGLLTLCAAAAGWQLVSLYVWRVTALAGTLVPAWIVIVKVRRPKQGPPGAESPSVIGGPGWTSLVGVCVMIMYATLSFQSQPPHVSAQSMSVAANELVKSTHSTSYYFWNGTLVLLAVGTLVFLALFVQRLQRGGAPQIETHWGGIGGGLGGWRMSASLGYLIVAMVLAVLFVVFFLQFDERERERTLDAHSASQESGSSNLEPKNKGLSQAKSTNDRGTKPPSEQQTPP